MTIRVMVNYYGVYTEACRPEHIIMTNNFDLRMILSIVKSNKAQLSLEIFSIIDNEEIVNQY